MTRDDTPELDRKTADAARLDGLLSGELSRNGGLDALRQQRDALQLRSDDLQAALDRRTQELAEAKAELARLEQVIRQLQRARFGCRSERVDPEQLQLALEGCEQDIATATAAIDGALAEVTAATGSGDQTAAQPQRPPPRRNRGHLPPHLERVERLVDIADKACPCCGNEMHTIREEVHEQLDVVPMRLRVLVTRRPVYGCRSCAEAVVQAPAPERPVAGGMPTEALLAHIVVSKYCDGLPLYRQAGIYRRDGVDLDRSTLCTWTGEVAWWLKSLWELMLTTVLASPKLFCDDTHLPVLAKGKTHKGALFGYARDDSPWGGPLPPAVVYVYTDGRKHASPLPQLGGFTGVLQVDGWRGFKALAGSRDPGAITLAFCWSHARRGFYEVFESTQSPIAAEVIRRIAELYQIEDTIRGQPPDERKRVRQEQSKPKVEALKAYIETQLGRVSGKSTLAAALRYVLNHWKGLIVFLEDGRVEIDSNTIERLHRLIATGRRNALFAGAESGARSWAIFVSLIHSARLNGHDPFAYLRDVLERIVSGRTKANQLDTLLPWNWQPASEPSIVAEAA